jgi:hypothetical protein
MKISELLVVFRLSEQEQEKAQLWLKEHKRGCRGNSISYKFTQTGIGVAVGISCDCGASKNITDYDKW